MSLASCTVVFPVVRSLSVQLDSVHKQTDYFRTKRRSYVIVSVDWLCYIGLNVIIGA